MSDERLEAIRERLEAASEPVLSTWVCFDGWGPPPDGERMRAAAISDGQTDVVAPHPRGEEIIAREEDLEFICHAPEDVRYLLDRVEALEGGVRELTNEAECGHCSYPAWDHIDYDDFECSGDNTVERVRRLLDNLEDTDE